MKKISVIVLLHFVLVVSLNAQIRESFSWDNSISIIGLQEYISKHGGFFEKKERTWVKWLPVEEVINYYAYDKKNKKLYVEAKHGNYVVLLKDRETSYYKKKVPNLKGDKLNDAIDAANVRLNERINAENANIQKRIDEKKAEEKQKQLQKEREDSLNRVKLAHEMEDYRHSHKYNKLPVQNSSLFCKFCDKSISISENVICCGASNDTITWMDKIIGDLGCSYYHIHKAYIPNSLREYQPYKYHYEAFKDSLNSRYHGIEYGELELFNLGKYIVYLNDLRKVAPNGYFDSWGWDSEYSNITFSFTYTNTNHKTIKYIEVFWKALNDVGDVRKTGSFKGTGPVEEWDSASWSWDHSRYYVAGDTSKMRLTKVLITYMDGSRIIIPQNKIIYK